MNGSSDRIFSAAEIREQREQAERRVAAQQLKLDALRKMADAMDQLEQAELAEQELEQASQDLAASRDAKTVPLQPEDEPENADAEDHAPGRTRERVTLILKEHPGEYLTPWQVWERAVSDGWAERTKKGRHAIRASLTRLAVSDDRVDRVERPPTHAFGWVENGNGGQSATQLALDNGLAHLSLAEAEL